MPIKLTQTPEEYALHTKERRKANRKTNPERYAKYKTTWYYSEKGQSKERKQKRSKASVIWREKNPILAAKYKQNYRDNSYHKYLLGNVAGKAAREGKEFNLDLDWLLPKIEKGLCEKTSWPFSLDYSIKKHPLRPSIDRVDSTKGYLKENCQLVCLKYNTMKGGYTDEEMLEMATALVSFKKKMQAYKHVAHKT